MLKTSRQITVLLEIQTALGYNENPLIGLASGERRDYGYEVRPKLCHGVILSLES